MSRTAKHAPESGSKRRAWAGNLIQNAIALMISSGGSALLGVAFWAIAAHLATTGEVGRATAEIAAMVLLANLAQLSFTTIFDRFLPVTGDRTRRFVLRAYLMCSVVALGAAVVYLLAKFGHEYIPSGIGWRILFAAAVMMWTIFVLQDSVLTGLRATRWVPVENILFSAAKIALLPVFLTVTSRQGLFLAWTLPVVLAIAAVNWYLFRIRIPRHQSLNPSSENYPTRKELVSLGIGQYAISLVSTFSGSIVALIVIGRLGPVAEAHYYLPALITTGGVSLLLWNLVTSFLVEASNEPEAILQHAKLTIRAAIIVLLPCMSIGVAFAPEILRIFGTTYAATGTTLLRLLLLSLFGTAATAFNSSLAWIDKRVWFIAGVDLTGIAIFFALVITLIGHFGITAIGIASLVLSCLQLAFFLPMSIRRYRRISRASRSSGDTSDSVVPDA